MIVLVVDAEVGHDARRPGGQRGAADRELAGHRGGQQVRQPEARAGGGRVPRLRLARDPPDQRTPRQGRGGPARRHRLGAAARVGGGARAEAGRGRGGTRSRDAAADADADVADEAAFAIDDSPVRVAIIGRPNVGKSSLLNALLGQERAIVSDIPGTTRDAIDTAFDWAGRTVRLVDTAGIRRRGKVASGPAAERFATLRALKAVTRADVTVLVIDAEDGLTAQDDHVAGYALEEGTGLVLAINKWDVVEKDEHTFDEYAAVHTSGGAVPGHRADHRDQRQDRAARGPRPGGGPRDRRRASPARADGRRQRVAARGHSSPAAAHRARPPDAVLLRCPGRDPAANVRAVRQRSGHGPLQLQALPGEPAARRVRLRRNADAADHPRADARGTRAAEAAQGDQGRPRTSRALVAAERQRRRPLRGAPLPADVANLRRDGQASASGGRGRWRMGNHARAAPRQARSGHPPRA